MTKDMASRKKSSDVGIRNSSIRNGHVLDGGVRDGSTFVEAAVVLPVCFLAVISVIYILMFLYSQAAAGAMVHVATNAAAGEYTETVETYEHVPGGIDAYKSTAGLHECFRAEKGFRSRAGGLLSRAVSGTAASSSYVVDEAKLIRYTDFFRG